MSPLAFPLRTVLCLLAAACLLAARPSAPAWAPIPPEVWAMKEDPAKGWKDAVVLEKETRIDDEVMQVLMRVRILSQAGKDTAGLLPLQVGIEDVSGRVVHRDGRVFAFKGKAECQQIQVQGARQGIGFTRIIPPGLSNDCVLEVWWKEKVGYLPASWGDYHIFRPGGAFATLEERIHLGRDFNSGLVEVVDKRLWKMAFDKRKEKGRVYTFKDLPAFTPEPFSLELHRRRPELVFYHFPFLLPILVHGNKPHWQGFALAFLKPLFEGEVKTGPRFKALAERVLPQLKGSSPSDAARVLMTLLGREFVNLENMSHQEYSLRDRSEKVPDSWDLEAGLDQGAFTSQGLRVLAFRLLRMAGFHPRLVLTADRGDHLIQPLVTTPRQFDAQYLAIPDGKDAFQFMDPGRRFVPPGWIDPSHQGTRALLLDPDQDWSQSFIFMPALLGEGNRTRYAYRIQAGNEQDRFQASATFTGSPELDERGRYYRLEQAEQDRSLRKHLESVLRSATLTRAQVLHATDPKYDVAWEAEGIQDVESGGRQRRILPFPGLPHFLDPPDHWPEKRVLPVVLPYLQIFEVESSITLPKGCRPMLPASLEQSNRFGKVVWNAQVHPGEEGTIVQVRLTCAISELMAPPEAQEDLKAWFAWAKEARERTIGLEIRP